MKNTFDLIMSDRILSPHNVQRIDFLFIIKIVSIVRFINNHWWNILGHTFTKSITSVVIDKDTRLKSYVSDIRFSRVRCHFPIITYDNGCTESHFVLTQLCIPNFYGYFNAKIIVWLSKGFLSIEAQERYKMKLLK